MNNKLLTIDDYNTIISNENDLSIILLNICSFNKHVNTLKEYLICFTIHFNIIILTETWLTENDFVQIYFEQYSIFQLNRVCNLKKKRRWCCYFG